MQEEAGGAKEADSRNTCELKNGIDNSGFQEHTKRKPKRNTQHSQPTTFHTDTDARQDKTSKKINDRHHVNVSLIQRVRGRQKDHRVRTYAQHSQRTFIARVSHVAVTFHISLTPTTSSQSSPPPSHQQQPHYNNHTIATVTSIATSTTTARSME